MSEEKETFNETFNETYVKERLAEYSATVYPEFGRGLNIKIKHPNYMTTEDILRWFKYKTQYLRTEEADAGAADPGKRESLFRRDRAKCGPRHDEYRNLRDAHQ